MQQSLTLNSLTTVRFIVCKNIFRDQSKQSFNILTDERPLKRKNF